MTKQNNDESVIEVPITEVETEEVVQKDPNNLDLETVAYMVMVGRTKDGETFLRTVGVNDLIVVRGLVEYARDEIKQEFRDSHKK